MAIMYRELQRHTLIAAVTGYTLHLVYVSFVVCLLEMKFTVRWGIEGTDVHKLYQKDSMDYILRFRVIIVHVQLQQQLRNHALI